MIELRILLFEWMFMMPFLGSTCICEQIFSHTKHTRDNIKTKILDGHLENTIAIICIKSDVDELGVWKTSCFNVLIKKFSYFF